MKGTDILLSDEYGLLADPVAHDLVVGDVTLQNQALILKSNKGEWKEKPMIGCGIDSALNDDNGNHWKRQIREELSRDGMKVRSLEITNDNIKIDAEYENDRRD